MIATFTEFELMFPLQRGYNSRQRLLAFGKLLLLRHDPDEGIAVASLNQRATILVLNFLSESLGEPTHSARSSISRPYHVIRQIIPLIEENLERLTQFAKQIFKGTF